MARSARQLIAHVQSLGGCLTQQDMAAVSPVWRDPLAVAYRELQVHTPPPPGEGFQFLLSLRILDGFDLAAHGARWRRTIWTRSGAPSASPPARVSR